LVEANIFARISLSVPFSRQRDKGGSGYPGGDDQMQASRQVMIKPRPKHGFVDFRPLIIVQINGRLWRIAISDGRCLSAAQAVETALDQTDVSRQPLGKGFYRQRQIADKSG
jgi:hypothetical protein